MRITAIARVQVGLLCLATIAAAANPINGEKKLDPGKGRGTFHFVYRGAVSFSLKPAFPTVVSITNLVTGKVAKVTVRDGKAFTLEADLAPGTYTVTSEPTDPAAKAAYYTVDGQQFDIVPTGTLSLPLGPIDELFHAGKMSELSPHSVIAEADPAVLKWPAVPGANSYRVDYRAGGQWKTFVTDKAHYELPKLKPGESVYWEVWAQSERATVFIVAGASPDVTCESDGIPQTTCGPLRNPSAASDLPCASVTELTGRGSPPSIVIEVALEPVGVALAERGRARRAAASDVGSPDFGKRSLAWRERRANLVRLRGKSGGCLVLPAFIRSRPFATGTSHGGPQPSLFAGRFGSRVLEGPAVHAGRRELAGAGVQGRGRDAGVHPRG